ncbi:MAG: hypothetical protein HY328_06155 [Chloroflexi bacterium]|nr:hypothetical protein [Chloroflexota bacterium]
MLTAIQGIYRDGKVILATIPSNAREEMAVIVTFLGPSTIDLQTRGIGETQAADLRARLAIFAEDWTNPEMDVYDRYDIAKASL